VKIDQLDLGNLFFLFVGEPKTGKTCAAVTFVSPEDPVYVFDIDKRIQGIRGISSDFSNVEFDQFDITKGFSEIDKKLDLLVAKGKNLPYKLVVYDGFTSTSDILISEAFYWTGKLTDSQGDPISWHKKLGPVDIPGIDEFAFEDQAFKNIILALKSLPCTVICTVHWTERFEKGKPVGKRISLRPATVPKVMKWFDEVYFFEKDFERFYEKGVEKFNTRYIVRFRSDLASTTIQKLPQYVEWTNKRFGEVWKSLI
jgi:hypothetical protein